MRLDKWLWAARFYKTRQLAVEAVNGGHVHLNGQRTKPGKEVQIGSRLQISKAGLEWDIRIEQLPAQRRPAAEALLFYAESAESQARRQARIEEERALRQALPPQPATKPNKRDRRLIHRFTQEP
ncbi:MAG: RNA-binding S4 domain-containing protein [Gammaproteobacteria bacterium]|nr:RNA-binding S4 domain-containing protein [Gammaproteobacteria bacterium]